VKQLAELLQKNSTDMYGRRRISRMMSRKSFLREGFSESPRKALASRSSLGRRTFSRATITKHTNLRKKKLIIPNSLIFITFCYNLDYLL
jgi:hypothetical protein